MRKALSFLSTCLPVGLSACAAEGGGDWNWLLLGGSLLLVMLLIGLITTLFNSKKKDGKR